MSSATCSLANHLNDGLVGSQLQAILKEADYFDHFKLALKQTIKLTQPRSL